MLRIFVIVLLLFLTGAGVWISFGFNGETSPSSQPAMLTASEKVPVEEILFEQLKKSQGTLYLNFSQTLLGVQSEELIQYDSTLPRFHKMTDKIPEMEPKSKRFPLFSGRVVTSDSRAGKRSFLST